MQYALLQPPTGADSASPQAGLTPPYPVKKEIPEMNAALIRRYIRSTGDRLRHDGHGREAAEVQHPRKPGT